MSEYKEMVKDGVKNIFHSDNKMCDTNTNFKDYFIFDEKFGNNRWLLVGIDF